MVLTPSGDDSGRSVDDSGVFAPLHRFSVSKTVKRWAGSRIYPTTALYRRRSSAERDLYISAVQEAERHSTCAFDWSSGVPVRWFHVESRRAGIASRPLVPRASFIVLSVSIEANVVKVHRA